MRNMKQIRLIGLISSIILAINYIIIGPAITFVFDENWFDTFFWFNKTFIFPVAFIGFYLALYKLVQRFEIKKYTIPVLIILGLGCIGLILNIVCFININLPDILSGFPGIVTMIVFILWAIQVIRNKDDRFNRIRNFAIAMLVGYAVVFIFTLINIFAGTLLPESGNQPFEYTNIAYAVYGIGYVFGISIFIEKPKKYQRLTTA